MFNSYRIPHLKSLYLILFAALLVGCANSSMNNAAQKPSSSPTKVSTLPYYSRTPRNPTLSTRVAQKVSSTFTPMNMPCCDRPPDPTYTDSPDYPTWTPIPTASLCHPAYTSACIPLGRKWNCTKLKIETGLFNFVVDPNTDPFGFDGDEDGIGCEED